MYFSKEVYTLKVWTRAILAVVLSSFRKILQIFCCTCFCIYRPTFCALPPYPGDKKISKKWLAKTLSSKLPSKNIHRIYSLIISNLNENRGLVGNLKKISITYSTKRGGSVLKKSLVLKMSRSDVRGRRNVIIGKRYREGYILTQKIGKDLGKFFPQIFYSRGSLMFGESVTLMEDVVESGGVPVNYICGNQVWGIPHDAFPMGQKIPDKFDVLEKMFIACAEINSKYWKDESLLKINWLKGVSWKKGKDRVMWEIAINRGRTSWELAKKVMKTENFECSKRLKNILNNSYKVTCWKKLYDHLKVSPFTLTHGDFHAANTFYLKGRVIFVDFSEVGVWEPTTDLAQTIISDLSYKEWGKKGENVRKLVKTYHKHLNKEDYKWEQCWSDFVRSGIERWLWVYSVLSAFPLPRKVRVYFHDQLDKFIEIFDDKKRDHFYLKPVVCIM